MSKKLLWKDRDFTIFINDGVDEKKFIQGIAEISQRMFGVSDEKIFREFLTPIGFEKEKREKR